MNTYTLFAILITIASLLLILVIMVQNPKGGGLSSTFGGGQMIGGVKQTNDFLEKSTWFLMISLVVLILGSNFVLDRNNFDILNQSEIDNKLNNAPRIETPVAPVTTEETSQDETAE